MRHLLFPILAGFAFTASAQSAPGVFERDVRPFLARSCYGCHGARLASAGMNLEAFVSDEVVQNRERWEKVLRRLKAGEMPPKTEPRPDQDLLKRVMNWIEGELDRDRPRVAARRLNRAEYNNSVRDLLGIDLQPANDFPQDDSAFGFDNVADALTVSPLLLEKQIAAAERIARAAVFGPERKARATRIEVAIPRRMEVTNPVRITQPAYYSMVDYDLTGVSQPGALHLTHPFPADGEYVFQVIGAGNRPQGSEPGEMTFWIDGKLRQTFVVDEVQMSGFERRPDQWEYRARLTAGPHEIVAAFPRQFEGLPPRFKGPNPSRRPEPPPPDPEGAFRTLPPDAPPGKIEERRLAIEKARRQLANPTFDGLAVTELDITGPYHVRPGSSPESLARIYTCGHRDGKHQPECERRIVSDLARRAFRRPAGEEEINRLTALSAATRARGGAFDEGISVAIQAMLVSPDFLFRIEKPGLYELASRLSYFLWSSMPDDELLRAAGDGTLGNAAILEAQVRRMLADTKSRALEENFAGQWLEIRRMESVQPDRDRFPDFDDYLRLSMRKETELLFRHMAGEDRGILDLIDAPYTFLNERLARHYGIRGVTGPDFRKVDLRGTGRGGVFTHSSVLTVSSYATRTSPVLRGKWILDNLLNAPPPPPPGDVPTLDDANVGESASLRQQLEKHRRNTVCASCHARMDPLGFSLENYDAVGAWREREGKISIDASGTLPDGREFRGAASLAGILRQDRADFAACLAEKLLTYALGRGLTRRDQPAVKKIVEETASREYRFSSLILGIVNSAPFQLKGENR